MMPPHIQNTKESSVSSYSMKSTSTSSSVPKMPTEPNADTRGSRLHQKSNDGGNSCLLGQSELEPKERAGSTDQEGIPIPLFLQPLLGLDLLPTATSELSESSRTRALCRSPSMPERSEESRRNVMSNRDRSLTDSFLETASRELVFVEEAQEEEEVLNDDILDLPESEQKRKRRSALGRFKSKVRKAKERRHQRRGRIGSAASASSCFDDLAQTPEKKSANQVSAVLASGFVDDATPERNSMDGHTPHTASTFVVDALPYSGVQNRLFRSTDDQLAWVREHQSKLDQYKEVLSSVASETQVVSARAVEIRSRISNAQGEIRELERILARSIKSLQNDAASLERAQNELDHLEGRRIQAESGIQATAAAIRNGTQCLNTGEPALPQSLQLAPPRDFLGTPSSEQLGLTPRTTNLDSSSSPELRRTASSSFMRVNDLDLEISVPDGSSLVSSTSSTSLSLDLPANNPEKLFFVDNDVKTVLEALARIGYDMVTDESDFFKPVRDTGRILFKRRQPSALDPSCPTHPWHHASGKEILVWSGIVNHDGFGSNMPVLKARGIVRTPPRKLVDLILDSSRVKEYNKMSLGRTDVVCLQEGVDTRTDESAFGLPGEAKITRSVNKPPMIRKNIELLSLIYARPEGNNNFLMVSRSVWEDAAPNHEGTKDALRTEMLLGVNYIRPINGGEHCEMTTITHVYSPSVPEMLAKSFAPKAAANFIRDIQALF